MTDTTVHALADHLILHGREVTVGEEELSEDIRELVESDTSLTVKVEETGEGWRLTTE